MALVGRWKVGPTLRRRHREAGVTLRPVRAPGASARPPACLPARLICPPARPTRRTFPPARQVRPPARPPLARPIRRPARRPALPVGRRLSITKLPRTKRVNIISSGRVTSLSCLLGSVMAPPPLTATTLSSGAYAGAMDPANRALSPPWE